MLGLLLNYLVFAQIKKVCGCGGRVKFVFFIMIAIFPNSLTEMFNLPLNFYFSVDSAALWAHAASMNNHGQNCVAGSRTFVQEAIYDKFVAKAKALAENRTVGDPFKATTMQGPQVIKLSNVTCFLTHRSQLSLSSHISSQAFLFTNSYIHVSKFCPLKWAFYSFE